MEDISTVLVGCLEKLQYLALSVNIRRYEKEVRQIQWQDELGRLRVWSTNVGAHQTGHLSLDYRLREASHIKAQTIRILNRLKETLEDLQTMIEGPDMTGEMSETDDECEETETQLIYNALRDTITNLFQLSIAIRRPSYHDRLSGTKRMDTARFEPLDFHHVSNKFPDASPDLIKRLALAITKRRAILCYRKRHSKGPGQRLEASFDDQSGTQSNQLSESDTHSSDYLEHSSISHTTEHISTGEKSAYSQKLPHSNASEAAISLPSAPAASRKSSPFECLYCYRIISVPDGRGWAHHVFRDLMPYVCTFPDCSTPHILYETRREWYFHLQSQHSVGTDPEDRIFCPLCPSSGAVGKKFEKHLGRHLEELALFALSRPDLDAENSKESQGDAERPASLGPEDITNRTKPNSDDGSEDKVADTPPFKKGSQAFPRDKSRGLFKQLRHASIPRHNDQPISPDEFFLTLETPVPEFEHLTIEEPEGELSTKDQFEDRCISASENEGPGKRANDSTRETESWISLKYGIGHEIRYPFWQCRYWNHMQFQIRRDFPHLEELGGYSLIAPNGGIIPPHLWESTIQPGWTILIHLRLFAEIPELQLPPSHSSHRQPISSNPSTQRIGTHMYICCRCHDGPKVYNVQPQCINCNHPACNSCTLVK